MVKISGYRFSDLEAWISDAPATLWMFLQSVGHSDLGVNVTAVPREISSCRRAPSERFGKVDDHKPSWFLISAFVPKLTIILRILEDTLC